MKTIVCFLNWHEKKIVCLWDQREEKFVSPFLHFMDKEKNILHILLLEKNVCFYFTCKNIDLFLILKKIAWFGLKFVTPHHTLLMVHPLEPRQD